LHTKRVQATFSLVIFACLRRMCTRNKQVKHIYTEIKIMFHNNNSLLVFQVRFKVFKIHWFHTLKDTLVAL